MALLKQIELINFRLFKQHCLEPAVGINLLCGDNATGKTSILEALWYISSGKSFRTKQLEQLIYNSAWKECADEINRPNTPEVETNTGHCPDFCRVNAEIQATVSESQTEHLSIYRQHQKNYLLYAGNSQKTVAVNARKIPLILITPDSLTLLGGTPQRRRNNLNWGCFYHYPLYQGIHARYQRALKQRNRLLKQQKTAQELNQWTQLLAKEASVISSNHLDYLSLVEPIFQQLVSITLPKLKSSELTLDYFDSVSKTQHCLTEQAWLEAFARQLTKDSQEYATTIGIHRADVIFSYYKQAIFQQLSRGEWKILASAFLLAQGVLLQQNLKQSPIVLMDDFSSELDATKRNILIDCMQKLNFEQYFISAVSEDLLHGKQALTIKL